MTHPVRKRVASRLQIAVLALACSLVLASCGGGGGGGDEAAGADPDLARPPGKPPAADCAPQALRTDVPPDDLVPEPGTYAYRNSGTQRAGGLAGEGTPLPRTMRLVVSPVRSIGALRCFTVHRPYSPQLIDNATFAVRGADVYLTRFEVIGAGGVAAAAVEPDPPIRSFDGDELEWAGSFSGQARGRYSGRVLGRRTIRAGGRRERAVGVELRIAMKGELEATLASTSWIGLDSNLVLTEETRTERSAEGPPLVLDLRMRLAGR